MERLRRNDSGSESARLDGRGINKEHRRTAGILRLLGAVDRIVPALSHSSGDCLCTLFGTNRPSSTLPGILVQRTHPLAGMGTKYAQECREPIDTFSQKR